MKVEFKKSFSKDLKKRQQETKLMSLVREVIEDVEKADSITEINNIKKLQASENCYRIRIGDFRIGLIKEDDCMVFVRLLNRKDIYRYFP